ncbi:MAG: hypothetical protein M3495_03720 [Pseudomonadota bacterium]|nr:hypothetical protein [Gammaproteobacteria bacterium]MDQ3580767.1 hypothetical protein [Pseudomonadota bacterium]
MPIKNRDKELEEIYTLYRAYITHEDGLVNQRTTWLVTIQSFLLATFGFSYQKKYEVAEKLSAHIPPLDSLGAVTTEYNLFLLILAIVGFLIGAFAFVSIYAAVMATRAVEANWRQQLVGQNFRYLPDITGGGNSRASRYGIILSLWTPVFFIGMWLVAIFLLVLVVSVQLHQR